MHRTLPLSVCEINAAADINMQDTVVAIRKGGDSLALSNLEPDRYPDITFSVDPDQEVDVGKHTWGNYFVCAYKGVYEHLKATGHELPAPVGLQVMVHGRVPTGSGLSSSAAIVCAAAPGVLVVHAGKK
jgi:N-acetylgalactosamine kinase